MKNLLILIAATFTFLAMAKADDAATEKTGIRNCNFHGQLGNRVAVVFKYQTTLKIVGGDLVETSRNFLSAESNAMARIINQKELRQKINSPGDFPKTIVLRTEALFNNNISCEFDESPIYQSIL